MHLTDGDNSSEGSVHLTDGDNSSEGSVHFAVDYSSGDEEEGSTAGIVHNRRGSFVELDDDEVNEMSEKQQVI